MHTEHSDSPSPSSDFGVNLGRNLGLLVLGSAAVGVVAWWSGANKPLPPPAARPIGTAVSIPAPLGLPPVPIPADNPPTAETIALGRCLYL